MDPPPCVQNAMMKQDKKPFTYTPGGLNLSEIKSPRMARRIERNANYTGEPELPRPASQQQPIGPLPPQVQAAMQPQMHVQVFPTGPPPPPSGRTGGAPPPPPPPPAYIPPPPPLDPLPTQKVVTSDNQVLERPDMTKIIPDNPMALLRKTGGPSPRKSFVEEMYNVQPQQRSPPVQQVKSPPIQQTQQRWPQSQSPPTQQNQQRWPQQPQSQSPPFQQNQPRLSQHSQSPPLQQNQSRWPQPAQSQSPPAQQTQQRWAPQQQKWTQPQQWSPVTQQPEPPKNQEEPTVKTSTAHLGSLYIPPINQQQKQVRNVASPPLPPKRDPQSPQAQSPSTPTLKEAPKPWQKQTKQTEELPPWAKREPVSPPQTNGQHVQQSPQPQQQQRFPQRSPPVQPQSNQRPPSPQSIPNAVFITQPVVLQHPGPSPNRQQPPRPRVDAQGAVIIPVQAEGAKKTPTTPGNERSFNRQQSWSNNPTQSNSFKIIQKITHTDDDDEYENEPITEHPPKYPQQFQQTSPAEQMRKLKLSEGDRELMNRFKQGVDDDTSLHNEVDPRYRGPAIPSKAFKLLQSMTDGSSDTPASPGATVSRGPPAGNRTPQVRNIPIQIERDDQPKNYIPPSEQTVPEPKKYTGSSIPSRSFKILQAMTAPDTCANANEVNENYDPSSYNQWGYDPNCPLPYPPYWPDYYYYNYYPSPKEQNETSNEKDTRQTPVPFWGYYPYAPPFVPPPPPPAESDSETNARRTPLPFWGHYPYYSSEGVDNKDDAPQSFAPPPSPYPYPPYWDPYYYYYGYPPVYSPYPFYGVSSDSEELAGYSSTDEMVNLGKKFEETKMIQAITPQVVERIAQREIKLESNLESSESETETEVDEEDEKLTRYQSIPNGLQTIKSVKDIKIYDEEQNCSDEEEPQVEECQEDTEDNDDTSSVYIVEDTIPHQLSVIYEESERTDTSKRESSILSDSTTIAEKSDDEEYEEVSINLNIPVKYNLNTELKSTGESKTEDDLEKEKVETNAVINGCEKDQVPNEEMQEEEEQDWWSILKKDEDEILTKGSKKTYEEVEEIQTEEVVVQTQEEREVSAASEETVIKQEIAVDKEESDDEESDASSTSSSDSSSSESNVSKKEKEESSSELESEEQDTKNDVNNNDDEEERIEPMSIKERIEALKNSIQKKKSNLKEETEIKISVKDKVSALEVGGLQSQSKTTSTKSSLKSLEEFSEEEGDSGVTSDMSRHISDSEEFPELKKMTRYQRAATHSRLFKLLQEECEEEEDEVEEEEIKEDKFSKLSVRQRSDDKAETSPRRDQLSLPLKNVNDESFSSSGITSPGSPVSEKLVSELVQSLLKRKKGQMFRNLPREKLQAAAKRILQEEIDDMSTPDSSFLSPLRNSTESSTPAQTPQEFYNDYKQYYDSWSKADNYDILPSKAFKLLQEHSGLNRTGAIAGLLAKCPKILSNKNVHQELLKLAESSSESSSSSSSPSPEPSEVTTAS